MAAIIMCMATMTQANEVLPLFSQQKAYYKPAGATDAQNVTLLAHVYQVNATDTLADISFEGNDQLNDIAFKRISCNGYDSKSQLLKVQAATTAATLTASFRAPNADTLLITMAGNSVPDTVYTIKNEDLYVQPLITVVNDSIESVTIGKLTIAASKTWYNSLTADERTQQLNSKYLFTDYYGREVCNLGSDHFEQEAKLLRFASSATARTTQYNENKAGGYYIMRYTDGRRPDVVQRDTVVQYKRLSIGCTSVANKVAYDKGDTIRHIVTVRSGFPLPEQSTMTGKTYTLKLIDADTKTVLPQYSVTKDIAFDYDHPMVGTYISDNYSMENLSVGHYYLVLESNLIENAKSDTLEFYVQYPFSDILTYNAETTVGTGITLCGTTAIGEGTLRYEPATGIMLKGDYSATEQNWIELSYDGGFLFGDEVDIEAFYDAETMESVTVDLFAIVDGQVSVLESSRNITNGSAEQMPASKFGTVLERGYDKLYIGTHSDLVPYIYSIAVKRRLGEATAIVHADSATTASSAQPVRKMVKNGQIIISDAEGKSYTISGQRVK